MPAGRPTKYTPALLERAKAYLSDFKSGGAVIPSVVGLSLYLGIRRNTMYDWAKQEDKVEFSNILDQINAKQHELLVNMGLTGEFNSNITKLVLGKHGYHDKQDTNVKAQVSLSDMAEDELDRKLALLKQQESQSTKD